jgi:hypothetical protein
MNIDEIKASIEMADAQSLKKATERWNAIAHPLHSLGNWTM